MSVNGLTLAGRLALGMKLVVFAVALTVAALLTVLAPSMAGANGSPNISLNKATSGKVLYGEDSTVTLKVSNPAGQPTGYNLSFRDVLPAGITYVANSAPANVGEPQVFNNAPGPGQTTLIWSNIADLTPNSSYSFDYKVAHNQPQHPVGSTYTNNAGAYINCSPRYVPDFNASGQPVLSGGDPDCLGGNPDQSYTGFAADSADTKIEAIKLNKSEPSPEGELLRGIHNHQTVYTLTVDNNQVNPSNGLDLEDYLPAGLEFIGCGGVDNTTDAPTNPGNPDEYAGSGPINPGNEPGGGWAADCVDPDVVETVANPPGLPPGIYTHVVWQDITNLAPGATFKLTYLAAVPIRANTLDWNGAAPGTGTAPGNGGAQAANLDNNSGPETTDEQALTNHAAAAADYQAPGGAFEVTDETDLTRTAENIRLLKSVNPTTLGIGVVSEWTLQIDVGEYRYFDDIVVTDTLGDGYCPLGAVNFETTPPPADPECDPEPGATPSSPYTSAVEQVDGTWSITWDSSTDPALARIQPSSSHTITFPTRTRTDYQQNFQPSTPVKALDTGRNESQLTGNAFIICAPGAPDACPVGSPLKIDSDRVDGSPEADESEATQEGAGPTIDKKVSPTLNSGNCSTLADYVDDPPPPARPGDTVCWRLTMTFPANLFSGDVAVTDFIPPGTTYVAGSTAVTANNTAMIASATPPQPDVIGSRLRWPVDDGAGSVNRNEVFEVAFAVKVQRNLSSEDGDISDNLMKTTFANTAGTTFPLRDSASFEVSQPEIDLVKGVRDINDNPPGGRGPNVDGGTVAGGDVVTYRVDVSNSGSVNALNTQVWDVLPPQISCSDVSAISHGGTCNAAEDRIEWPGLTVAAATSSTLTYDVTIPDGLTAGDTLVNNAGVRQFESPSGSGPYVTIPANNIDPTQGPPNAPAADDPSNVKVAGTVMVKSKSTEINEPGNDQPNQATIGEEIYYKVTTTIPAGTSLYGSDTNISDVLGSRQTLVPGSAAATLDNGNGTPVPLDTAGLTLTRTRELGPNRFPRALRQPPGQRQRHHRADFHRESGRRLPGQSGSGNRYPANSAQQCHRRVEERERREPVFGFERGQYNDRRAECCDHQVVQRSRAAESGPDRRLYGHRVQRLGATELDRPQLNSDRLAPGRTRSGQRRRAGARRRNGQPGWRNLERNASDHHLAGGHSRSGGESGLSLRRQGDRRRDWFRLPEEHGDDHHHLATRRPRQRW